MSNFKIGIMIDCMRLPFEKALLKASEIGADGFQMGFTSPDPMPGERIAQMRELISASGLTVSAVCGEIGSYTNAAENERKFKIMENVFSFASAIGTKVVTGHIGVIPEDKNNPIYEVIHGAMIKMGRMARERGVTFAAETGPENTALMRDFLDGLEGGVGVNFDPANLVMARFSKDGADSVAAVAKYIVHTHAKDGLPKTDTEHGREVPLGEGKVDFPKWMRTLRENGYSGFLTIEREVGDDPVTDCVNAMSFLRRIDASL